MWSEHLISWLTMDWAVALAVMVAGCVLVFRGLRRGNYPPGPYGLPLVGYLPFLGEESFRDFINLGKKYGDIFSLQLGSERVVVLHGSDAIREAFGKPQFLGRPPNSALEIINRGSPFFASDMHLWHEQRRFVVHALKDLGLGKTKIEGEILDEISRLLSILAEYRGAPIDFKVPLSPSMSNNISALVFGKRFPYDHPDRQMLDSNLDVAVDCLSQTDPYTFFPWLHRVPFSASLFCINNSIRAYKKIIDFFGQEITHHKETFDPNNIRDFIDSYLIEIRAREGDAATTFTETVLQSTLVDLFEAGSETVRVSIMWCAYIAAAYPEIQTKVRAEMSLVTGGREPEFRDMRASPYTHAVLLEIMRWKTTVPLNVLHYTTEDTTLRGYDVPRNTIVISNIWNVHHDPRYWPEPDTFRPERFLSEDGRSVLKSTPHFMPFSVGKRACPEETMAYMEIFLYFTSLLQRFEIAFPEGYEPDFKAKASLNYRKEPYQVRFIPLST